MRDDEVAAALAGLNVARLQVLAFVISAACAGLGGALLAVVTGIVAPGAYTLTLSIALLTATVVGGLGSLAGALWGSLLLVLVPSYLTNVAGHRLHVHRDRQLRRHALGGLDGGRAGSRRCPGRSAGSAAPRSRWAGSGPG